MVGQTTTDVIRRCYHYTNAASSCYLLPPSTCIRIRISVTSTGMSSLSLSHATVESTLSPLCIHLPATVLYVCAHHRTTTLSLRKNALGREQQLRGAAAAGTVQSCRWAYDKGEQLLHFECPCARVNAPTTQSRMVALGRRALANAGALSRGCSPEAR
jgi:hypothetical protein